MDKEGDTVNLFNILKTSKLRGAGGGLAPNERAYQVGNAVAGFTGVFTTSAVGANS